MREAGAGGLLSQFEVILQPERPYTPQDADTFRRTAEQLRAVPGVAGVISPFLTPADLARAQGTAADGLAASILLNQRSFSRGGDYLRLTVIPDEYLRADQIDALAAQLRAAAESQGYRAWLGGAPIGEREFSRALENAFPKVVLSVFAATFVLLLLAFRSLVVPLKSIVLNGLTVAAAGGIVTLVVQRGVGAAWLGFPPDTGVLDATLPLLLFTVMFGLSMDYEIFLLSRVQEAVQRGESDEDAIAEAVSRTARIITSAALIMFVVFAAFIGSRVAVSKSVGLGLAAAVVLDATLVRLVLVPAVLKLAGRWNWWLPGWLAARLPHIRVKH
ncbi:MMPL family transporter [Deinococcus lacus]|uniref:MMPL family transporter n=1 Tax=Deinococcus lacus TaxID=392561 RepID=A0ABW1YHT1_9DEIO